MERFATLILMLALAAGFSLADQWVGWLADEKCARADKASSSEHAGCAQKCVEAGQPIVLVSDADKKVYKVDDQEKVKEHVGRKVTVKGTLEDETIKIEEVSLSE